MAVGRRLISFDEGQGVLVEVEVDSGAAVQASARGEIWDVRKSFATISTFLRTVVMPFTNTWHELSRDVEMDEATIKLSVGVSAEGNFFLARGEGSANFEVAIKFRPTPRPSDAKP